VSEQQQRLDQLNRRIDQAAAWCAIRADIKSPKASLRSLDLAPNTLETSRASAVESTCWHREQGLKNQPLPLTRPAGRLLIHCPDFDIRCGTVEAITSGFFDLIATPPWDTWIAFLDYVALDRDLDSETREKLRAAGASPDLVLEPCLLAWIPSPFEALAQRGIEADPYGCLAWLDLCPGELSAFLTSGSSQSTSAAQPAPRRRGFRRA
jgi:hypothetical protein